MEKTIKVIVDTDILIKAFRGDATKIRNLSILKDRYCISVITAIELIDGAKNIKQLASLNKVFKVYTIIHLDQTVSRQAFQLYRRYSLKHSLGLSDCFIACTSLADNLELYTDNKKDYNFIEGIKFYKER